MAFSNSWYNEIMRDYEKIRREQLIKLENREKEVYEKVPKIKELSLAPSEIIVKGYKEYLVKKDKGLLDKSNLDIENIKKQKEKLLLENGFETDYLELKYNCYDCKDTGTLENSRCHCFNKKLIEKLYEKSNLSTLLDKENFDNFNLDNFDDTKIISKIGITNKAHMKKILDYSKYYVDNFKDIVEKDNVFNLLLLGETGVGKSFLSSSIAKALIAKAYSVIYLSSIRLFEYIMKINVEKDLAIEKGEYEEVRQVVDYVESADLLIIDDLGSENISAWVSSQLFKIINYRLNNKKAVIISSNLSLNKMRELYSERFSSRLLGHYKVIDFYGEDIRIK